MKKSGASDGDPAAAELKEELRKAVEAIVDGDGGDLEQIDRAQQMLCALKELKVQRFDKGRWSGGAAAGEVPEEFKCPLSKELMRDPVIVATGQTYDRPFIQKWLKAGNRTCPETQQVLSHTSLTPNHLIREMIPKWCKNNGIKFPDSIRYTDADGLTKSERSRFLDLLGRMSAVLSEQREAAKELRLLTKRLPSFRSLFGESPDAVPRLLSPLSQTKFQNELHPNLQEDLITTLLNISIHDSNKKLVAETPMVIPILMNALTSGTIETRSNAAATLFTLSALDSNKVLIGKSGAIKPLIDLLDEGHPLVMKDVASAIFNLCIIHDNKVIAVRDGAVEAILKKIISRTHVDELLSILAVLSTNQTAIDEMGRLDAVPILFCIIRETSCPRNKENCIAILHTICFSDRSKWKEMRDEESTHRVISHLAQNGTSRAKRKANGILERLNRTINLTHTA
ncbi:U-box domain-containing protein 9-like [Andrographis paniculata]|uniref:U-box domain-containing protein 9-like n=1 Tax=Andrographis paniculata TaxID=175694 RepID=UPI0021E93E55|nr:U-box domain-containing protein 9-like [Andrographis paniculata]